MNSIAVYSASKWGVRGLSKSAAIELGRVAVLSDDSRGSTGSDYAVDAGFTAGLYCGGSPGF
jgi:hypothetical protein